MPVPESPGPRDERDAREPAGEPSRAAAEAARRRVNRSPWNWLLLAPLVAVLFPWFYNREEPTLAGIPFFYWYQMAAIGVGVAAVSIVYLKTRGER